MNHRKLLATVRTLGDLRSAELDIERAELQRQNAQIAQQRDAADQLDAETQNAGDTWLRRLERNDGFSAAQYARTVGYLADLQNQARTEREHLETLEAHRQVQINVVTTAHRRHAVLEKFEDRLVGEIDDERRSLDAKEADENWNQLRSGKEVGDES